LLKLKKVRIELDKNKFFATMVYFAPTHQYGDFYSILKGTVVYENHKLLKKYPTFLSFDFWVPYTGSLSKN